MPARILPFGPVLRITQMLVQQAAEPLMLDRILRRCTHDPLSDCLSWHGALATQGKYGITTVGTRTLLVHRAAYEAFYGAIQQGSLSHESDSFEMHHKCVNRVCCNPNHLQMTTRHAHNQEHQLLRAAA